MRVFISKFIVSLTALAVSIISLQIPYAQAAMVSTSEVIASQKNGSDREKVVAFLDRTEVQEELQRQGVSADAAKMRVAQLSDEEVQMLAGKIDEMPAGGVVGELIGAAVFIFLVLLITDLLGFTDVYPFVHHHAH